MAVESSRILDLLAEAVQRTLRGEDGAGWVFFHCMTQDDVLAFDLFLVRMDDPLAYEAGTTERRWRTRVQRMADLERARREENRPSC